MKRFCIILLLITGHWSQVTAVIPRDRSVLSKRASTVASCTSATVGQWSVNACTGSVDIHTNAETITVPAGNSGSIRVHSNNNPDTVRYKINSGSFVNLTNNGDTTFTVNNSDTITFDTAIGTNCAGAVGTIGTDSGTVFDATTGATLDTYSISF